METNLFPEHSLQDIYSHLQSEEQEGSICGMADPENAFGSLLTKHLSILEELTLEEAYTSVPAIK